jgi:hypothetical protein
MKVNGQLQAPAALSPRNESRYPLDERLGGPQGRSGRCGEEKSRVPLGIEFHPAHSLVTILRSYPFIQYKFNMNFIAFRSEI